MSDPVAPRSIALAYLTLAGLAACLVALPRAIASLVGLTRIDAKRIDDLVSSITLRDLEHRTSDWGRPGRSDPETPEREPLFILGDIAVRALREHDRVLPVVVASRATARLLEFMERIQRVERDDRYTDTGEGQEWRAVINAFLMVFRPVTRTAISVNAEGTLDAVCSAMGWIAKEAAAKSLPWYSTLELNEALEALAVGAATNRMTAVGRTAIRVIQSVLVENLLHNVAPQEELWEFNETLVGAETPGKIDKSNQWSHVSSDYARMIARIVEAAADAGSSQIVMSGIYSLARMRDIIEPVKNLGVGQRERLIVGSRYTAASALQDAVTKLGGVPILGLMAFQSFHTTDDIAENKPWAKPALLQFCLVARMLAEKGIIVPYDLNALGTEGRGAVRKLEGDDVLAESVVLLAETIGYIADEAARARRPGFGRIVREAEKQLESFERWERGRLARAEAAASRVHAFREQVRELMAEMGAADGELEWPMLQSGAATPTPH